MLRQSLLALVEIIALQVIEIIELGDLVVKIWYQLGGGLVVFFLPVVVDKCVAGAVIDL